MAWPVLLVLSALLHATLLVDATAFARFSAAFDHPWSTRLEALIGFVCIAVTSIETGTERASSRSATTVALPILALLAYAYHLMLLRWPWLTGQCGPTARLTEWAATLSSTWSGIPALAFVELLCLAVLWLHGFMCLSRISPWQSYGNLPTGVRVGLVGIAFVTYTLACATVIVLATGAR